MEEGGAVSMVRKPANPATDHVAIKGRIKPHPACPWLAKAIVGFRDVTPSALPRPGMIRSARVEIERPKRIDYPARREMHLLRMRSWT
jgi:hypothetical protein